jgi:hypothetical protein
MLRPNGPTFNSHDRKVGFDVEKQTGGLEDRHECVHMPALRAFDRRQLYYCSRISNDIESRPDGRAYCMSVLRTSTICGPS